MSSSSDRSDRFRAIRIRIIYLYRAEGERERTLPTHADFSKALDKSPVFTMLVVSKCVPGPRDVTDRLWLALQCHCSLCKERWVYESVSCWLLFKRCHLRLQLQPFTEQKSSKDAFNTIPLLAGQDQGDDEVNPVSSVCSGSIYIKNLFHMILRVVCLLDAKASTAITHA